MSQPGSKASLFYIIASVVHKSQQLAEFSCFSARFHRPTFIASLVKIGQGDDVYQVGPQPSTFHKTQAT